MAKILVVDDRAANRKLLVTLIGYHGHQAIEAVDGAQALTLARSERPELVISDILMPTMDGFELVRQLRADPALRDIEVIFCTAHYREREARGLARACGVSRVLLKPFEPADIFQAIDQSLKHIPLSSPEPVSEEFDREHLRLMTDTLSEKIDTLQATNRRLAALTDLNLHLASEHDPKRLLAEVCRGARDLLGAKWAMIGVNGRGDEEPVFFTSGLDAAMLKDLPPPNIDAGALGQVRTQRRSRRMAVPRGDMAPLGLPSGYPEPLSCLMAPISSLSHAYGWVCLVDKLGSDEFSGEDEQILAILAAQVGRIYENGSLYSEVQRHTEQLKREVAERSRAEAELRASEAGLNRAQLLAKLTHVITGPDGAFESWPATLPQMIGVAPAHMPHDTRDWLQFVHPDDRETFRAAAVAAQVSAQHTEVKYRLRRADGTWLNLHQVMEPLEGPPQPAERGRWFNTIQDITEQTRIEHKITRLNRVYATLSGINTLIVRVRDREELFRQACRVCVEDGGFRSAWIGIVDPDRNMVVPVAAEGTDPQFLDHAKDRHPLSADSPHGETLVARAIRTKTLHFNNHPLPEEQAIFGAGATALESRSIAILPLLVDDGVLGVLALSSAESDLFDDQELKLLTELAGDISFALDHIAKADRLIYLAFYDEITGLPNRSLFLERVGNNLRGPDAGGGVLGLALIDIDRFSIINATLGRQVGDELLKLVAQRILHSKVKLDTVARVGANCFGVVVRDPHDAAGVALAIEQVLRACFTKPFALSGSDLRVAGKAGIALNPVDGADTETLFRNAEAALKRAKGSAEAMLFYAANMNTRVAEALNLESKLRTALDLDQFVLHYQPKVSLQNGQLTGVEALIRWNDPELGMVPPGNFIPMLEQTGLIYEVGRWALRQATGDHLRWRAAGLAPLRIAVNVSPLQLRHRGFVSEVQQVIGSNGAASGLELEITESMIMEDVEYSVQSLDAIRKMGVSVAIDDFGTGFSSLSHIAKLPVDTLKIDRSFIVNMTASPQGLALVSTIINLAHALKLKVVAEGVETKEQLRLLELLNCDEVQGFLMSRPVSSADLEARHLRQDCGPFEPFTPP